MKQYKIKIEPCGKGDCGTFIIRLLSGDVTYPYTKPHALTPEEIKTGYILICCSVPYNDCILWLEE